MLGFKLGPVRSEFVVDIVAPGQVSFREFQFFPVSTTLQKGPHPHELTLIVLMWRIG